MVKILYFLVGLVFGLKIREYIDSCYMEDKFPCHK